MHRFAFPPFPVSLQPFEFVPAEKNKHKFMVQSMYAPEGEIHQDLLVSSTKLIADLND